MSDQSKYEESTLLSLLSQDSEYAFQVLFDQYRDIVYRTAIMYVKSPMSAEEVVQDVFLKLWYNRHTLREIKSIRSWLFIVTRNITFNSLKKIAHEWSAKENWIRETKLSENAADHKLIAAEYRELLETAIGELSPQQQQIYRLAKEGGLSYKAIGLRLNISPLTVKTHLSRAIVHIRSFLAVRGVQLAIAGIIFTELYSMSFPGLSL